MGILRTDKISGLETPTAVTGSVNFPGSDDYITAPANTPELLLNDNDFTIEGWFYKTNTGQQDAFGLYQTANNRRSYLLTIGDSNTIFYYNYTGSSGTNVSTGFTLPLNKWAHVAITRDGTTLKIYVDGKLSGTTTGLTSGAYANTNDQFMIGSSDYSNANGSEWTGHISNLRIVKGYVLYDGDFTVPDHALEVVPGTVLLACNNPDSVTAVESALVGKGLTLTAVNDVAVTSVTPGLTRDFTSGTEFRGVTTFDTQGYFVPPSGTTEQRGRGRGVWAGGYQGSVDSDSTNIIEYITISSMGNSIDFGDRRTRGHGLASFSSSTRGVFLGGRIYGVSPHTSFDIIDFIQFSTTANALDFGDITSGATYIISGASNSTRGILNRGSNRDFITIASKGSTQTFGTTSFNNGNTHTGFASPTRGFCAGGGNPGAINTIDYVTIQSTGNALNFGDLTFTGHCMGTSNTTRGVIFAGGFPSAPSSDICYITMASTGNAQDFGDLTVAMASHSAGSGCASATRAVRAGGYLSPSDTNAIEYVTIASTGNAKDFGDLLYARHSLSGCSDSHGGLS